ncbi:MAG TPA: hypothetical protein VIM31_02000 [Candidatus Microsaccharimonas sp.]|jgi:hypothetical protein
MGESESSWAEPVGKQLKTPDEMLEERYADRANPDNIDDMVVLPSERTPQLIEVPDWAKESPVAPEAGYEAGFDDNPFALGKEVNVKRHGKNGNPDYQEGGWKIIDDDANVRVGKDKYIVGVVVEKEIDGEVFQKSIPLNELMERNPRAEKEPLTKAKKEVADEAIEDAIGLEDPSEVDGDAHKFTHDEMKAMREAAQRVSGLETKESSSYDALLDPNTPNIVEKEARPDVYVYLKEALPTVTRGETEASQKYYDKFVTEENRQVSLDFLDEAVKADVKIAAILHEAGLNPSDMAAVDAIRENPDVRYQVAKRLTQKLDTLADRDPTDFGIRIANNSPNNLKVDPQTGKRMLSRMYAVDTALKMLGGEFSERNEANDFARDSSDRVAIGQHRHAARTTIMSRYA